MATRQSLAPMLASDPSAAAVRSPKTSELVALTLRKMIVDGQLKEGDFLPHEAELMAHFQVSRPTLREAVRVLESERLVEVRRGSRTGARVRVPGAEIIARPAGLLLELSGATVADVMTARTAIEPAAAKLLAENGNRAAPVELRQLIEGLPAARKAGRLASASATLHRRMIELSGNATLAMIAGMLHEISERPTAAATAGVRNAVGKVQFDRMMRSWEHLVDLIDEGDGAEAEAHWRRHMENSAAAMLKSHEQTKVRDIMR